MLFLHKDWKYCPREGLAHRSQSRSDWLLHQLFLWGHGSLCLHCQAGHESWTEGQVPLPHHSWIWTDPRHYWAWRNCEYSIVLDWYWVYWYVDYSDWTVDLKNVLYILVNLIKFPKLANWRAIYTTCRTYWFYKNIYSYISPEFTNDQVIVHSAVLGILIICSLLYSYNKACISVLLMLNSFTFLITYISLFLIIVCKG